MKQTKLSGLYVITPEFLLSDTKILLEQIELALEGGASIVQYRCKSTDANQMQTQANALRQLTRQYGCLLIINDHVLLAKAVQADGVHLGQSDEQSATARKILGTRAIIGVTCHDKINLAGQAIECGADYVAFGRFFNSSTKPDAPPAPLSLLTQYKERFAHPVVAIGGINEQNAVDIMKYSPDMLAVSYGVFGQKDVKLAAQRLCEYTLQ